MKQQRGKNEDGRVLIIGIGTDIIEIERIKKACDKDAFLSYVYTEKERELIAKNKKSAAGNWCVKEAVVKAFGTGFRGCKAREIEVLRDEKGKPIVNLYGGAKEIAERLQIKRIFASISDTKEVVTAFVVAEGDDL